MRRAALAVALLPALLAAPASRAAGDRLSVDTLAQAGAWSAFRASGSVGDVLCGVDTVLDGRRLVSVELLSQGVALRLFDPAWTFAPGTLADLRAEIGARSWEVSATGVGPLVEWRLDGDAARLFLEAFREGRRLDIALSGHGPSWRLSLAGSGAMLAAARACAAEGAGASPPAPGRRWL